MRTQTAPDGPTAPVPASTNSSNPGGVPSQPNRRRSSLRVTTAIEILPVLNCGPALLAAALPSLLKAQG